MKSGFTGARRALALGLVAATAASLAACSSSSKSSGGNSGAASTPVSGAASSGASGSNGGVTLPAAFKDASLVAPAVTGYPPYAYLDGSKIVGISADLAVALGGPFGKTVSLKQDSFENSLLGVNRGVYFGVFGADVTADREKTFDQVSFLEDHYEFMSLAGSAPLGTTMDALCGLKISVVAAASSIPVLQQQSKTCTSQGKPAITVLTFADQGSATLAVKSKQADATTATVTNLGYIAKQAGGFQLGGPKYLFVYIGIATKKGNGMAQSIADAINKLIANGSYAQILAKYGVEKAAVKQAEVNPDPNPTQ